MYTKCQYAAQYISIMIIFMAHNGKDIIRLYTFTSYAFTIDHSGNPTLSTVH